MCVYRGGGRLGGASAEYALDGRAEVTNVGSHDFSPSTRNPDTVDLLFMLFS